MNKSILEKSELFNCCMNPNLEQNKNEINCRKENNNYYLDNKIHEFNIDSASQILYDFSKRSLIKELNPPTSYFNLLEIYSMNFF